MWLKHQKKFAISLLDLGIKQKSSMFLSVLSVTVISELYKVTVKLLRISSNLGAGNPAFFISNRIVGISE